jgi:hypothetical protein
MKHRQLRRALWGLGKKNILPSRFPQVFSARFARDLLDFLQEFEAKLIEEKGEISPDSDEAQLIEWATITPHSSIQS